MHDERGATPGVLAPKLTRDPLGTSGELSPGPDHLRPEIPQERRELERRGYLPEPAARGDSLDDYGVMDDGAGGPPPSLAPLAAPPPDADAGGDLGEIIGGPIFE